MTQEKREGLLRQRLQRVHVTTGIAVSLFMYVAVFFGIWAIWLPYVQTWERPSRHFAMPSIETIDYSMMIDSVLSDPDYPTINGVHIFFPGHMNDPALRISAQFAETIVFNPSTGQRVKDEGDQSQLAFFLNSMHYGRPFKILGYLVFGFVAVAVMFLIVGGLMLVYKVRYKNHLQSLQSRFSKWHRRLFLWLFAPFVIVTMTGALMNIGYLSSPPMAYIASKGETHDIWRLTMPILFPSEPIRERQNDEVPMLSVNDLILKTKAVAPEIDLQQITLYNWGDSSARAKIEGYDPYKPFLNGISNKPSVTLSGVDGKLIAQHKVMDKHWSGLFVDSVYFLHFLFGVNGLVRTLIASIMAISAMAIGVGVLLYLEKQAKKFPKGVAPYHWMGRVSLAVMVGVFPAVGLLFVLQWILPFEMEERFLWQKGAFALLWLGTLTWSFYRLNAYEAAKELLKLGGILFMLAPLVHFYGSGFSPAELWRYGMGNILSVDVALFGLGAILWYIGGKLPLDREGFQAFGVKNL